MFPNDAMPRSIGIGEIVLQLLIAVTQGDGSYGVTPVEKKSLRLSYSGRFARSPTVHTVTYSIAVLHLG